MALNEAENRPDAIRIEPKGIVARFGVWWTWRWSTRKSEEQLALRNPHLAEALRLEKMEGQRIATWARTAALAVIAVLLIFLNPRPEMLYYEAILLLFVALGIAQLRAARVGQSLLELALILADLLLLTLIFILPNPFAPDVWPSAFRLRFDGFDYFYVFLASATLAYSWRTVQTIGVWVPVLWLLGVGGVMLFGTSDAELSGKVKEALSEFPRMFDILDPDSIGFNARIQEITIFFLVAMTLALKSRRANQLLMRQADLAAERANLSRYFAPSMVEELAHRNEPMGPVRSQQVAVLFADLVGFTTYAETHPPEDVIALLREFHARLDDVVFAHSGTLDKFMGDGLMASFGTPKPSNEDAANAISAAFAMQESITSLNAERSGRGLEVVRLSVGVHYGPVILGDIGNARRMEFATLGDTVNVASRLEGASRSLGCGIVVSQAAMEAVSDAGMRESFVRRMHLHQGLTLRGRSETQDVWIA